MKKADFAKSRRAVSVEARPKKSAKKMTIDDLAIMVTKGFDGVHQEIGEVKGRLGKVEDRLGAVEKRIENVEDDLAVVKHNVLTMGDKFVLKYEFNDLANRVGVLEEKAKGRG